ncbi:MAG: hypothetical protein IT293_07140 [Deltaproteobacteria bacterium]|nr:hypothetical protein [Deltaproteobacteria bacterium]
MATKTPAKKATARGKKTVARKTAAPRARRAPAAKTAKATKPAPTAGDAVRGPRRAVFIDVENTSSEHELARVLDELEIDLAAGNTEVTAIGNWRVVGQQLGRSLAQRGAHLVHSAPATRVSDWSDLWIAVQAGIWLGRSRPGDAIDIVSHDRAFDAVGDAAARLGVAFNRITYRSATPSAAAAERAGEGTGERRRRRRRRGGSGRGTGPASASAPSTARPASAPPRAAAPAGDEPHAASQEQLQHVIARLAAADPAHTVTLDALTVALKAAGFQRPPGSPRLVTRLRRMKDIAVLPNGRVQMVGGAASASVAPPGSKAEPEAAVDELEAVADEAEESALDEDASAPTNGENGTAEGPARRRPRRRGGRRRGGRGRTGGAATPAPATE